MNKKSSSKAAKLSSLLYFAHTNISSLKAKYQKYRNIKESIKSMRTRNISVGLIRSYPALLGPLLDPRIEKNRGKILWKRPYFFKKEDVGIKSGSLVFLQPEYYSCIRVNKEKVIENTSNPSDIKKRQAIDLEKEMGLDRTRKMSALAIEETYSNYLALQELFINPISFLIDYNLDRISETGFLNRQAYYVRAYLKPHALFGNGVSLHTSGDYSDIIIDSQSGLLLKQEVYFKNSLIESFELTKVEINEGVDDSEFESSE